MFYTGFRPSVLGILITSRTRSSLVAKIFSAHGFVCGKHRRAGVGGYETYENIDIVKWLADNKKRMNYKNGRFCTAVPGVERVIPENGLFKVGVEYWPNFRHLDADIVTVKRNPEDTLRSLMQKNKSATEPDTTMIMRRFELMRQVREETGGVEVDTDEIIAGEFRALKLAFDRFGLDFDSRLAAAQIMPWKQ